MRNNKTVSQKTGQLRIDLSWLCLVVVLLFTLLPACRKKTVYTYDLSGLEQIKPEMLCYKETGTLPLGFTRCLGLAVSPDRIYATGDKRLTAFTAGGVLLWNRDLPEAANCLAWGENGLLYLGMMNSIAVYDAEGREEAVWAELGEKAIITSVAVTGAAVFAADAGNRQVIRYTLSGKLEKFIGAQDTAGNAVAFIIPGFYFDLAAGMNNTLWVVNPGYHRLEQFTPDGEQLTTWGESGFTLEAFSGCCNPVHIALLPDGNLVTAEKGLVRIKIYNTAGTLQCAAAAPQQFKTKDAIADMAVNAGGDILLLDSALSAVRIFSADKDDQEQEKSHEQEP